jgi:hypothetical protein
MYIIPNLRDKARKSIHDSIQDAFANNEVEEAVKIANAGSVPVIRKRRMQALVDAFDTLGAPTVLKSWRLTGLPNALWDENHETLYKIYADALAETGALDVIEVEPIVEPEPMRADLGQVNAEAKKRGRPPLSAEERGQRAALKREREEEEERLRAMPQHLQQLAKSAKGHGKLDAFLTKK